MRDSAWYVLGMLGGGILLVMMFFCGAAMHQGDLWREACGAQCRKVDGGMHSADEAWCVCKNGRALKYDAAGLYGAP